MRPIYLLSFSIVIDVWYTRFRRIAANRRSEVASFSIRLVGIVCHPLFFPLTRPNLSLNVPGTFRAEHPTHLPLPILGLHSLNGWVFYRQPFFLSLLHTLNRGVPESRGWLIKTSDAGQTPGIPLCTTFNPPRPRPLPSTTMGGRVSIADQAGKARSDEIDRQIEEDRKRFQREIKILVLGPSP